MIGDKDIYQRAQSLLTTLTHELDKYPEVVAFVLVGSFARDNIYTKTPYSDIEAYIVAEDNKTEEIARKLPALASMNGNVLLSYKNRWAGFSVLYEDLLRLELPVITVSQITSVFSRPKTQPVKPLIDKTGGKLKKALDLRPETIDFEKIFKDTINDFWYMTATAIQYLKKGELWLAKHTIDVSLTPAVIKFMELLNDKEILLLEERKRIEQFLTKEQINNLKQLSPLYESDSIETTTNIAIDIFENLTNQISNLYGYKYSKEKKQKIKVQLKNC